MIKPNEVKFQSIDETIELISKDISIKLSKAWLSGENSREFEFDDGPSSVCRKYFIYDYDSLLLIMNNISKRLLDAGWIIKKINRVGGCDYGSYREMLIIVYKPGYTPPEKKSKSFWDIFCGLESSY